jgi:hypothetical protein
MRLVLPEIVQPSQEGMEDQSETAYEFWMTNSSRCDIIRGFLNTLLMILGVAGRNSDNTFIKQVFGWEPNTLLRSGLAKTYKWIEEQYADRKAGKKTVIDTIE